MDYPGITIVHDDQTVVSFLKELGDYDFFMEQVEKRKESPNAVFSILFESDTHTCLVKYFLNHEKDEDNGWSMIEAPNELKWLILQLADQGVLNREILARWNSTDMN